MERNVGLFNESFPPVMDGVAVCVENYARWIQEKVGGVSVVTPRKLNANYGQYPYEVLDYASVPVPFRHPYVTGIAQIDPLLRAKLYRRRFKIVHAHSPFSAGLMALQVAKTQHIPLVATFHSKFKDDFREVIPSDMVVDQAIKIVMEFFDRADEVWVPQASVEEVIREYGFKGHVEVVDNGSDLVADYSDAYFEGARKALGIAPEEFVFLFRSEVAVVWNAVVVVVSHEVHDVLFEVVCRAAYDADLVLTNHFGERKSDFGGTHCTSHCKHHFATCLNMFVVCLCSVNDNCRVEMTVVVCDEL